MTTSESLTKIAQQAAEIDRLRALLAARPTEIQLFAATQNAAYFRDLFEKADAARKVAQRKLWWEREFAEFVEAKHAGEGVAS